MSAYTPIIFTANNDNIPKNILKKALLKGFLFLLIAYINANTTRLTKIIPA